MSGERNLVRQHCHRLWREGRIYVWIEPAGTVEGIEQFEVHFNMQSYWTTVGLRPRGAARGGNLAWALERAKEPIDRDPNCRPRKRLRMAGHSTTERSTDDRG